MNELHEKMGFRTLTKSLFITKKSPEPQYSKNSTAEISGPLVYLFVMNHSDPLNRHRPRKSWVKEVCLQKWIIMLHVFVGCFSTKGESAVVGSRSSCFVWLFSCWSLDSCTAVVQRAQMLLAGLYNVNVCFFISSPKLIAFLSVLFSLLPFIAKSLDKKSLISSTLINFLNAASAASTHIQ